MGRSRRADDVSRAVLRAPLLMSGPGWGSRSIADEVGVSQSMVARVWTDAFSLRYWPRDSLPSGDLRLAAVCVSRGSFVLVLSGRTTGTSAPSGDFMRSARRPALQTVLAADLLRESYERPDGGEADRQRDERLVEKVLAAEAQGRSTVVLTRTRLTLDDAVHQVVVDDAVQWQALLPHLVGATTHQPVAELRALQLRIMEWARSRRRRFEWLDAPPPPSRTPVDSSTPALRPLGERIAEQAFELVLSRVASGQLGAGDRVTETSLARGLHTSRAYVREAVRTLAAQGLIELEPNRGAVVPLPRVGDVIDTYSARRALGGLLVERAAGSSVRDLAAAERALEDMLTIAKTGDARACGDADLRFQDALAGATTMRHVPGMFRTLTAQVLLFTTVMGLRYVYSIPSMCRDDIAILAAVQQRDPDAAVRLWQTKIDDALAYMATQL